MEWYYWVLAVYVLLILICVLYVVVINKGSRTPLKAIRHHKDVVLIQPYGVVMIMIVEINGVIKRIKKEKL